MGKIEYGSVYKFLVSLGVILVFFPFVALYLLATGEVKPISQSEMCSISLYSFTMLERKYFYTSVCHDILPYFGAVSFGLGVVILVWGFLKWLKIQSLEDSNLEMDNRKKLNEIKQMTPTEKMAKAEKKLMAQGMPQESDDLASAEELGPGDDQENAEQSGESREDETRELTETRAEPAPDGNQGNAGQDDESRQEGARELTETRAEPGPGGDQENAEQSGESREDETRELTETRAESERRVKNADFSCIEKDSGIFRRNKQLFNYLKIEDQSFDYLKRQGKLYLDEYSLKRNVKIGAYEYDAIAISKEDNVDLLFEVRYWPSIPNLRNIKFSIQHLKKSAEFYERHMKRNFRIKLIVVTRKELVNDVNNRFFSTIFGMLPGMIDLTIIDERELQ